MISEEHSNYDAIFAQNVSKKIPPSEIIQKAYLRPMEIVLKTPKYDNISEDGRRARKIGLPQGLMIACKRNMLDNTFKAIPLKKGAIPQQDPNQAAKCRSNLINLLKDIPKPQPGHNQYDLEVAICVCIYSQDLDMLNNTLQGVKQNIVQLVKSGVSQDRIAVFIVFDGIEKIDKSILPFFTRYEALEALDQNQRNIYKIIHQNYRQYTQSQNTRDTDRCQEIQNSFAQKLHSRVLYNEEELSDRKQRSFQSVHKNYMDIIKLRQQIATRLKNNTKNTYQQLPEKAKQFYIKLAREDNEYLKNENIIQKDYKFCRDALSEAKIHCDKYLDSRNDLAYLSMFQVPIKKKKLFFQQQYDELTQKQKQLIDRQNCPQYNFRDQQLSSQDIRVTLIQKEEEEFIKMNLFLCVKYKNQGKLSSHNWFFNGFCKELKPNYVILLDVGLKPKKTAIYNMYNHMKINPKLGGVCGYMSLKLQSQRLEDEVDDDIDFISSFTMGFVNIQRAQQVQYHFAHLLDKPFQSFFDFIHVLPGAFSGYNMKAIFHDKGEQLLRKYFSSLQAKLQNQSINKTNLSFKWWVCKLFLPEFINSFFVPTHPDSYEQLLCNENMNLAEDRILCMGIYKSGYSLAYLPDAYSEVDPIMTLHSMFGQRRRWINGSFFAFEKVKEQFFEYQSEKCKGLLYLQMLYLSLVNSVSYFSVSLFFFTVHISMKAFYFDALQPLFSSMINQSYSKMIPFFVNFMDFIYVMVILSLIYMSLNLNYTDKIFKRMIYSTATVMGVFSVIVFIVLVVDLFRGMTGTGVKFIQLNNSIQKEGIPYEILTSILRIVIISVFGLHALPIIVHGIIYRKLQIILEVVFGVISFLFYNPTYLITLNIYAICRVDDVTWGTKGRDEDKGGIKKEIKQQWKYLKYMYVFKFIIWNTALSFYLLNIEDSYFARIVVTMGIMGTVSFLLIFKAFLGMVYLLRYKCISKNQSQNQLANILKKENYYIFELKQRLKEYKERFDSKILEMTALNREQKITQMVKNIKSIIIKSNVYEMQ